MYSFVSSANEQYANLSELLDNMTQLYQSVMAYYAVDMKKVSVEDFFNDLNNFRTTFMVWAIFFFSVVFLKNALEILSLTVLSVPVLFNSLLIFCNKSYLFWCCMLALNFSNFRSVEKYVVCSLWGRF